ncbi:hypothetical protein QTP70_022511, partial [Hemibagrus guttatus]
SSYAVEYIVVVEINVSEVILIQQLKSISLQLDNATKISTVNVTTVCQLYNIGYQCRCEDQYFWSCDKCMQYGQCNGATKSPCYCINGVPDDGQFCQPLTDMPNTTRSMSLTLDEKFDIALTNQSSEKYNKSKTTMEKAIDKSYRNMAGYIPGSVRVLGFRPGSIIVDFMINTTTNELDFKVANSELFQILTADGFKVNENSFAYSGVYYITDLIVNLEYNLTQNSGKIYPLQDILLNCTLTSVTKTIQWQVGGVDPFLNPVKYTILNNNRTLKVKSVTPADSGIYKCITETNPLRNIQWQRIVIQPFPNIQVDPDKVYKCDNLSIPLQCCAQSSYLIEWTKDSLFPLTPPGQGSGCIIYNYIIWKKDCEAEDKIVTFTCRLSNTSLSGFNYSSASISINITQREFTCSDSSFGVGAVNQIAFRQCDGAEIGIQWAMCSKTGQWSMISNNCTLRVIQNLAEMAENLNVQEVPMFVANLSNAAQNNIQNITTVPVNLLKVVDLLSTIANISKTQSVTVDKSTM